MRTRILKKVAVLFVSALMIVAAFAGFTFTTSATAQAVIGESTTNNATAKKLAVWGFNGKTPANAVNYKTETVGNSYSAIGVTTVDSAVIGETSGTTITWITVDLSADVNTDNKNNLWVKTGTTGLTVALSTDDDASDNNSLAQFNSAYTFEMTVGSTKKIDATTVVEIVGVDKDLAAKDVVANKKLAAFLGYDFSVVNGSTTYKMSDAQAAVTVQGENIQILYTLKADATDPSGIAYLTGSGGAILANQQFAFIGKKDATVTGTFVNKTGTGVATVAWTFAKAGASTAPAWTGDKDDKWTAIATDFALGKLSLTVDGKTMAEKGYTFNYVAPSATIPVGFLTINTYNDAIPAKLVMKFAKGTILGADTSYTITLYDETAVIALADGSSLLINIKVNTNKDIVTPLTANSITTFKNEGRRNLEGQVALDATSTVRGVNKSIIIDLINGRAGQNSDKYFKADKDDKTGTKFVLDTTKKDVAKIVDIISFVGYNNDGSNKVQSPTGYGVFYVHNMFTAADDAAKEAALKSLWGESGGQSGFRMNYDLGGEVTTMFFARSTLGQQFTVDFDSNTYAYSIYFVTPKLIMDVNAVATGVAQKVDAKFSDLGDYQYVIDAASAATIGEYAVGGLTKTEKAATIALTSYYDPTLATGDGNDYNKTGTVLTMRVPAGTKLTVKDAKGCVVSVLTATAATFGHTASDGMVDAFVNIDYATFGGSSFVLTLTYTNGIARDVNVNTTFVLKTAKADDAATKAFVAFSNNFGTTLSLGSYAYGDQTDRISAIDWQSNPNSAQQLTSDELEQYGSKTSTATSSTASTGSDVSTAPETGNAFNALAYILTIGATTIGGISTLVIRKRK